MIAVLVVASGWCGTGNQQLRGDDSTADKTKEYEIWRLREIHGKITQLMNQSPASPQERLYGSLSSLHFTQQRQHSSWHPSQLIRQLVNTQLHIEKGEPVRDALELLVAKRPGLLEKQPGTDRVERWRGITVEYEKLAGEPLAWDWTTRRDFWLDYAGWVIESIAYEDPAQFWKEKIDNDAAHADLYRLAYLEVLRADPEKLVQSRLLQPYLDADEIDEHEQILRACLIASLTNPGRSPGDRRLQNRAKNQVLQLVSNDKLNLGPSRKLQPAFRLLYQNIEDRDRTALIRAFLRHQKPAFTWLAFSTADVPEEEIQQWFLARQTNVVVNETPLSSVLTQLSDQVRLPLWFDSAVMNDNRSITLESSGSWLEMLEAVLKETPYKVHLFKAHVIWVGPPEGRKQAEELLRGALSRGAQLPALLEPTECEWIDNAWQDAVDFMSDLHDFQLIKLWQDEAGQGLVTLRQSVVPACLVLALVAEQANLEWEVAEQSVLFLPRHRSPEFAALQQEYRRRQVKLSRLKLNDNQLPGKLSEETEIELFRTSLAEGMEFIGDLHDFDIATIGDERAAADVNRFLRGMPAGWGLTLLLAEHGMTWDVEGERVIVAIEKDLAAYKKLAAVREKRRLNYTPATSSKLRNSVYFNIHEADTNALLQLVSEKIGMKVSFGPKAQVHGKKTTVIHPADVPADVLLDMVAAHFGLTWTVNEQGEVVLHGTDWQPKN